MQIGLIDVDGHNFPNLALMKISAWHKAQGDDVEMCFPLKHYDIVYQSKVFDNTYSKDIEFFPSADKIIKGGTGYFKREEDGKSYIYSKGIWIDIGGASSYTDGKETYNEYLPYEIEHIYPDYELYPELTKDTAYGFLTRGCPRACGFCIVAGKEGRRSHKVANLNEFWRGQKNIELLDPNLLACKDRMELLDQLIESRAIVNINQGFDIRLTNEEIAEKLGQMRIKRIHFAWDNPKQDLTRYFERFAGAYRRKSSSNKVVYILVNYDSTMEENLYRVYKVRDLGYDPYVMVYDKPNAPREIRELQRWVNNKFIFRSCEDFNDYKAKKSSH